MNKQPLGDVHQLVDLVDEVFAEMYEDPIFRVYLTAESDDDALEGAMWIDEVLAARMLHEAAPEGSPLRAEKLDTVRVLMLVVMHFRGVARSIKPDYGDDDQ